MRKKTQQRFTCLTLFKQDIQELIALFQTHLQDVVVLIDGKRILDSEELDQFGPTYQAQSLLVQGFYHEAQGEEPTTLGAPQFIELRMNKVWATLLRWQEAGQVEPEILAHIRKLLQHRVNRLHQAVTPYAAVSVLSSFSWPLLSVTQERQFDLLPAILLAAGLGTFLGIGTLLLFTHIMHYLTLDTRVFLFPGATEAVRPYGRREMLGTVGIALTFFLLVSVIVALGFRIL